MQYGIQDEEAVGAARVWRSAISQFARVWARGIVVCLLMVVSLLFLGGVLELFGIPIFDEQPNVGWSLDVFLFNWAGWVLNYLAYAILMARLLGPAAGAGRVGIWPFIRSGLPVFVLLSVPSALVSTWMPDGSLTFDYVAMMVPQSLLDVVLSLTALCWALRRFGATSGDLVVPNWRELPIGVAVSLLLGILSFLVGSELLYTAIGSTEWQVMTGSDELSAIMNTVAFAAAIIALYLNVVATPCLVAGWYVMLPSVRRDHASVRQIFG